MIFHFVKTDLKHFETLQHFIIFYSQTSNDSLSPGSAVYCDFSFFSSYADRFSQLGRIVQDEMAPRAAPCHPAPPTLAAAAPSPSAPSISAAAAVVSMPLSPRLSDLPIPCHSLSLFVGHQSVPASLPLSSDPSLPSMIIGSGRSWVVRSPSTSRSGLVVHFKSCGVVLGCDSFSVGDAHAATRSSLNVEHHMKVVKSVNMKPPEVTLLEILSICIVHGRLLRLRHKQQSALEALSQLQVSLQVVKEVRVMSSPAHALPCSTLCSSSRVNVDGCSSRQVSQVVIL
jgi:hypothetical protein